MSSTGARLLLTINVLLAACASVAEMECRKADWYDLGFRDAIFGLQRQEGFYAHECAPHGVKVDVARYVQGWNEGRYDADYRNPQPIH